MLGTTIDTAILSCHFWCHPFKRTMLWYPICDGHDNFQNIPRYKGFYEMGRNERDKIYKNISKCQVEKKNNSFPTYIYMDVLFCKS